MSLLLNLGHAGVPVNYRDTPRLAARQVRGLHWITVILESRAPRERQPPALTGVT
jgi:hypothetical protein